MAATIDPSKLKGMVSEDRLKEAELNAQKKEPVKEEGTMTEKELALLIEIGYSINKKLERLVEIFEGVAKQEPKVDDTKAEKPVQVVNKPEVVASVEKQVAPAPQPTVENPRIKEIKFTFS